jgi:hypothetical protein
MMERHMSRTAIANGSRLPKTPTVPPALFGYQMFIPITLERNVKGRKMTVTAVKTYIALVLSSPRTLIELPVY